MLILGSKTYLLFEGKEDQVWGEHTALTQEDSERLEAITLESVERLEEIVRGHIGQFDRVAVALGRDQALENKLLTSISYDRKLQRRVGKPLTLCDSKALVGTMRMIKDEGEINNLKEAGARTSKVHNSLMQQSLIGRTEREVCNWIEANFLLEGMQWTAYETIVGTGLRSTTLHARATDRVIQSGDLVLIDAGGEWCGYCADVTRVIPAGNAFSFRQRQVYRAVLAAQKLAIKSIRPGVSLATIHDLTVNALVEEFAKSGHQEVLLQRQIGNLMPHPTSHWIGLDVHDPSPHIDDNGNAILLAAGMSFTVEPGLYFRDNNLLGEYFGIGVRIEDDVVVTESGCELLSSVPKEIDEVEQLRSTASA